MENSVSRGNMEEGPASHMAAGCAAVAAAVLLRAAAPEVPFRVWHEGLLTVLLLAASAACLRYVMHVMLLNL